MSCTITYPTTHGACTGTDLITACGTWNTPVGSAGGTVRIFGKLYSGASTDAKPPADAVSATVIDGATRSWHFNASPLPNASIGNNRTLKVWITADDVACYEPATQSFLCCDAASGGCPSAPCASMGAPVGGGAAICADLTVIRTIAPRMYRLELDDSIIDLAGAVGAGSAFQFPRIVVAYSLEHSTNDRAVWLGQGLGENAALSLEVMRTACGGLCADLTLQRIVAEGVAAPLVWEAESFDLVKGGRFVAVRDGEMSGSVLIATPVRAVKTVATQSRPTRRAKKR